MPISLLCHIIVFVVLTIMYVSIIMFSINFISLQVAGMTKSPYPLLDTSMLGPLLACLNVWLPLPFPEVYVLLLVAVSCTDIYIIIDSGLKLTN